MGLGAGTIYTESPYDWFERLAKPELRKSSIRCSAPERWSEIKSADGPALRGSCADEAAAPRGRRLCGAERYRNPLPETPGSEMLRHAGGAVLAGGGRGAGAGAAAGRRLLSASAWISVPARHRSRARTDGLYRSL